MSSRNKSRVPGAGRDLILLATLRSACPVVCQWSAAPRCLILSGCLRAVFTGCDPTQLFPFLHNLYLNSRSHLQAIHCRHYIGVKCNQYEVFIVPWRHRNVHNVLSIRSILRHMCVFVCTYECNPDYSVFCSAQYDVEDVVGHLAHRSARSTPDHLSAATSGLRHHLLIPRQHGGTHTIALHSASPVWTLGAGLSSVYQNQDLDCYRCNNTVWFELFSIYTHYNTSYMPFAPLSKCLHQVFKPGVNSML